MTFHSDAEPHELLWTGRSSVVDKPWASSTNIQAIQEENNSPLAESGLVPVVPHIGPLRTESISPKVFVHSSGLQQRTESPFEFGKDLIDDSSFRVEAGIVGRRNASCSPLACSLDTPSALAGALARRSSLDVLSTVGRGAPPVAQSKSTKEEYSPITEEKERRDVKDDGLVRSASVESSTIHEDGAD